MLRGRRRLMGPFGILVGIAVAFPLGILAASSFTDVPPGHPFYYDVQAVADKGVTTGCGGGNYCPDANVTRGEMAAFMNRLGALSAGKPPVVNADKVDGYDAAAFLKAGAVKQQHFGPWTPNGNSSNLTTETYSDAVSIDAAAAGGGFAQLPLVAPTSIGGVTYGLASVQICTLTSTSVSILNTYVYEGYAAIINDTADRTPGGCYTVNDPTPTMVAGSQVLLVQLQFTAAGRLLVSSTTSTWQPTTMALAKASAKSTDTTAR